MANVKHITLTCPQPKCFSRAFVQVVIVDDKTLQPKIDGRARLKLKSALNKAHEEGAHDE